MADTPLPDHPTVCVVIEGYNEAHAQGTVEDAMGGLRRQDYDLGRVHVVLVGGTEQAAAWAEEYADPLPFASVRTMDAGGASYYELKNRGAEMAQADIVAFTDSDVVPRPTWLASIEENLRAGADVSAGISLFRRDGDVEPGGGLLPAAALMTFGWIVNEDAAGQPVPQGFIAHNVAFRAEVFEEHSYPTEFGRTCSSVLLFQRLQEAGLKIVLHPDQLAGHYFTWPWWITNFHFRVGFEVYQQRRIDPTTPSGWVAKTGPLEPLVTMAWHTASDLPRWLRVSRMLRMSPTRRLLMLPAVVGLSLAARGAEAAGMVATMIAPARMRAWAETS